MVTTRQLVEFILERDPETREWFANNHGFTIEKARSVDLSDYEGYVAGIVNEGLRKGIVSQRQIEGPKRVR